MWSLAALPLALLAAVSLAHSAPDRPAREPEPWEAKYGPSVDLTFSGINTFAHLPHHRCLDERDKHFDVAILGMPFDTAVSYRPGARFGPFAIRAGSRRHASNRGYNIPWAFNPFKEGATIFDCGDVPVSPYDNAVAIDQIEAAYDTLLARPVTTDWAREHGRTASVARDGREHPRLIALGGDHTISLPTLRSLKKVYGPIAVVHFDAHLDTWDGHFHLGSHSPQSQITHGSMYWKAGNEGLIDGSASIHAGIRTRLSGEDDLLHDERVGFKLLTTDDIDHLGPEGIASIIRERVGDRPVYLSFDIDTLDPAHAPATGTPEAGGWTTREVKRILRRLTGLNLVAVDIVEVSPAYDTNAEVTAMVAADLIQEFLSMMMKQVDAPGERVEPAIKAGVLNVGADRTAPAVPNGRDEL